MRRQGYSGTGLKQIIEESGAPRGSLYFHFPGGKEELAVAALSRTCQARLEAMRQEFRVAGTASDAVCSLIRALREDFIASDYEDGCPLATVVLEMSSASDAIRSVCAGAWQDWTRLIQSRLEEEGHPAARAARLATLVMALIEGSLLLGRAYRSHDPFDTVMGEIPEILIIRTDGGEHDG